MDRYDPRDDDRDRGSGWDRDLGGRGSTSDRDRNEERDPRDVFTRGLDLPGGRERRPVRERDRVYEINGTESRMLGTIGAFRVVSETDLHDLRDDSPTRGQSDVFYLGEHNRALLFIPHGVAHGYRVLGAQPMGLVYYTTHVYNPADELRRDWDDPAIGFNWTTVNR